MDPTDSSAAPSRALDAAFAAAALVAGALSLVVACGWLIWMQRTGSAVLGIQNFVLSWVAVALLASTAGWLRLHRAGSVSRKERMRLGSLVLPPLAATAGASMLFLFNGAAYGMSVVWITGYGLILLNTRDFLGSAIVKIGWLFLGTGIALMTLVYYSFKTLTGYDRSDTQTLFLLALTFGAFHLLHALGYAQRQRDR